MKAEDYLRLLADLGIRGRVYIFGPMRGYPNLNKEEFYRVEKEWRKAGWLVVNPSKLDSTADDLTFQACMKRDFKKILQCHAIASLQGWNNSEGANWEYAVAKLVGIKAFNAYDGMEFAVPVQLTVNGKATKKYEGV